MIGIEDEARKFGMVDGDILVRVLGEEINMKTARGILEKVHEMSVGDPYEIVVRRDGNEITLSGELLQRKIRHVFEEMKKLTLKQQAMRESWMNNLDR